MNRLFRQLDSHITIILFGCFLVAINIVAMFNTSRLLKEIIVLILISSALGILAQTILPNGIGLETDITIIGADSDAVQIPTILINSQDGDDSTSNILLTDAFTAFTQGSALFLDARSQEDYQSGHIRGAINLPAHAFMDSLVFLDKLSLELTLITYCDGADCNASIDLAADLKLMGFARVHFFFGGWQEWIDAGFPTDTDH